MIATAEDVDFDSDTPLTQLRLATQLPNNAPPANRQKNNAEAVPPAPINIDQNRTLQILLDKDLNKEGPAVAAVRRAQKRRNHEENGHQLEANKKTCTRKDRIPEIATAMAADNASGKKPGKHGHNSTTGDRSNGEVDALGRVVQKLRDVWSGDEHCGVPSQWRVKSFDAKAAILYLNLCQSAKTRGTDLACLWINSPQYLELECRKEGKFSTAALRRAAELFERDGAQSLLQNTERLQAPPSDVQAEKQSSPTTRLNKYRRAGPIGRQVRCSKDQELILTSSGVEYPPLPGNDQRPGAMPQKVFEDLTAQADAESVTEPTAEPLDAEQAPASSPASEVDEESRTQQVSASQWPASPDYDARRSVETKESTSRETSPLSSVPTSTSSAENISKLHKRMHNRDLPPDSSQVQPSSGSQRNVSMASSPEEVAEEAEAESEPDVMSTSSRQERAASSVIDSQKILSTEVTSNDHFASRILTRDETAVLERPISEPASKVLQASSRPVQVARTPFPGKAEYRPTAEDPTSTFVPSTFQDFDRQKPTAEKQQDHSADMPSSHSKPDAAHAKNNAQEPQRTSRALKAADEDLSASQHARNQQELREWRRNILKPISKEHNDQERAKSAEDEKVNNNITATKPEVIARPLKPVASAKSGETQSSPPPGSSMQQRLRELQRQAVPPQRIPTDTPGSLQSLYQHFCNAYPDYRGSFKQFETACRLLVRHSTTGRIFSWLKDSFVFHYAQSYSPYLNECHENGDDPSPYLVYFDKIKPGHMKEVIELPDLQACFPEFSATRQDQSKVREGKVSQKLPVNWGQSHSTPVREATKVVKPAEEPMPIDANGEPSQHLGASQKSSVEEWLEKTHDKRAPSPELGTQGIDRSMEHSPASVKRPQPKSTPKRLHDETNGTTEAMSKRPRLEQTPAPTSSPAPASHSKAKPTPRASLPVTSNRPAQSTEKPAPLPPKSTPVRRSLPASFASITKKANIAPSASLPTSAVKPPSSSFAKPALPPRRVSDIRARINASSPGQASGTQKSSNSVTRPSSSATTRKSLDPEWWKEKDTPLKRFAACWMNLPQ